MTRRDVEAAHVSTSAASLDATVTSAGGVSATVCLAVGKTLGPYHVLEKLGEGGMGSVYKAVHTKLDKVVAIKILSTSFTNQPDSVARFEREMKAVGKLSHPNIVQAHDAGEIAGTHYLAMEYVEGSDLQKLVKDRGPFSVVNACKTFGKRLKPWLLRMERDWFIAISSPRTSWSPRTGRSSCSIWDWRAWREKPVRIPVN